MFCPKCGAQVENGTKFCPKCGQAMEVSPAPAAAPTPEPVPAPAPEVAPAPASTPVAAPAPAAPKKPNNLGLIIAGCLGAFLILFVLMIVILVQPKKINMNKYVTIEFYGYETIGTAKAVYDEEAFITDLKKALKIKDSNKEPKNEKELAKLLEQQLMASQKLSTCRSLARPQLDKANDLSNGDTVVLSFDINNDAAKEYGIKFVGKEKKFKAEGLQQINVVDAFADIEVKFTGTSPNGNMEYNYNGNIPGVNRYQYAADKTYGLRNGDTVTLTLNINENYLIEQGYKIKEFSKTYTVSGLDAYITDYSELPKDFIDTAKRDAEDIILSYCAQSYPAEYQMTTPEYAGYIFTAQKPDDYYGNYNGLYIIYKSTLSHSEGSFTTREVYYPVYFYNILSTAENGITRNSNNGINGSSNLYSYYYTNGYTNAVRLFSELTNNYREHHNIVGGDGFEKYASHEVVSSLDGISEGYLSTLENEAITIISQYCNTSYAETSHATNFALVGYYFLSAKNTNVDVTNRNKVYVVYSATLSNSENKFETTTVYYPVEFQGIVKLSDGSYTYMNQNSIAGNVNLTNSWWNSYSTKGYTDGELMYKNLITSNRQNFTYDVSEGLTQFGN